MEYYGITAINNVSYKSYLHNRCQTVSVYNKKINNSSLANSTKVKHVNEQGSKLGLLFFITYMNSLPEVINNGSVRVFFVSDTSI
jgi:hypothetical protein